MGLGSLSRRGFMTLFAKAAMGLSAAMMLKPAEGLAQPAPDNLIRDPLSGLEFLTVGNTTNPKHVLAVFHGSGDNAQNIRVLGEIFARPYADLLVLVPNGPVSLASLFTEEQIDALKANQPG